jgi:hypothetical protein
MKTLRNEDGVALIISLMFTLICLGMILMLMYSVLSGIKSTGAQAKYRSSLEASYGGVDFITKTIIPRMFGNYSSGRATLLTDFGATDRFGITFGGSLQEKLSTSTNLWSAGTNRTVNPKDAPDMQFTLPGATGSPEYKVYSKITDTVSGVGLLDSSGIDYLDAGIGVAGTGSATQTLRTPNMYTIEVQGESAIRPKEKANLTVLYAY